MAALVKDPHNIRLGLAGMLRDNHHPFSWSAIINGGYDAQAMGRFADPVILRYLSAQPPQALGIPGARVTHIWCDDPEDAQRVAAASRVPHIVSRPQGLLGQVDAVLIPTDRGEEHVARARLYVEAGIPVFIDKPLTDREQDLRQFQAWVAQGKAIMSCSALRFSVEFAACRRRIREVGRLKLITITMVNSWERYGMHALEGVYPFLPAGGWLSVVNTGSDGWGDLVHAQHGSGVALVAAVAPGLSGAMGHLRLYGSNGMLEARFSDSFRAFKAQLSAFVDYLRTGVPPFDFQETVELTRLLIAGIRSREEGGRRVMLAEIAGEEAATAGVSDPLTPTQRQR